MEQSIKIATKRVANAAKTLKSSLDKRNSRLITKHMNQLKEQLDNLIQTNVAAEMAKVGEDAEFMVKANSEADSAFELLLQCDEFLVEAEQEEAIGIHQRVSNAKLKDLRDLLGSFKDSLNVELSEQGEAIGKIIDRRKDQMRSYQDQKINLVGELNEVDRKSLEDLYLSVNADLDAWTENALKSCNTPEVVVRGSTNDSECTSGKRTRGPGLKLDPLSLPIFKGDIRGFARFKREFEATVGTQFPDPKIQLLYLKNQCLGGAAKESVKNLTEFEEVMGRLTERYGKTSVIVDKIIKDVNTCSLPDDEAERTISLARVVEEAWDDIKAIEAESEFCNVITLKAIESKLPKRLQILWAKEKKGKSSEDMKALKLFLDEERKVAEEVLTMRGSCKSSNQRVIPKKKEKDQSHVGNVNSEVKKKSCYRCGFGHLVKDCRVPSNIKCRRCQRQGHIENACREPPVSKKNNGSGADLPPVTNCNGEKGGAVRLPIETINTEVGACLALWDSGSALNLINGDWAESRGLSGKVCNLEFRVVDGSAKSVKTKVYNVPLKTRAGEIKVVRAYGLDSLAASVEKLDDDALKEFVGLLCIPDKIEEINNPRGTVQLLLGSNCIADFPEIMIKSENMCLMKSCYGTHEYFVVGSHEGNCSQSKTDDMCHMQFVRETPLHDVCDAVVMQVERNKGKDSWDFMSVEELGIRPPPICNNCKTCQICKPAAQLLTLKEYREMNVIKSKLVYDHTEKKWTASYPFLRDPVALKDNFEAAFSALKRKEIKLMKDEALKNLYDGQVNDFVERGVLRKLSQTELQNWDGPVRYVDHHEVFKEGSTTPLRIVVNSSFRKGNEYSLNDLLMKGPNVLTNLLEILIRWRLHPVAFVGDISKMYHNIKTGEVEGHLRRFLWRSCNQDVDPDVYCFDTVTFGDRPAGCIAVCALKATADMFSFVSRAAADIIEKSSYMDDVISGANTVSEAKELSSNVEKIAEHGGFKFKKFVYSFERDEGGDDQSTEKVLGITWKPTLDTLKVSIELNHAKRKKGLRPSPVVLKDVPFTKRICLRLVNGIFDPLGIFSPVTIRLKILMRDQFVIGDKYKKWDTVLEPEDRHEWIKTLEDVGRLNEISVPRHPWNAPYPTVEMNGSSNLVCFADASTQAMCAAVYLRHESCSGEVSAGLLVSKTKVAPAKAATLPRLELCASLLCSRLLDKVMASILFDAKVSNATEIFDGLYVFLDSKIALGTLNKGSLSDDFTGSCVSEVRGKTEDCKFGWVQSEHNIADLGTRGTSPEKVGPDSEWQKGPFWLCSPIDSWPVEMCQLEKLPDVCTVQSCESVIDITKFSDLQRLHKHTALCLKFARSKGNGKGGRLDSWKNIQVTPDEYQAAELHWVSMVSKVVVQSYKAGNLTSLRPVSVWDERGNFLKIVTSGRLGKLLKIGYDVEELTILDPEHPYTYLVLKHFHDEDHCGDDRTVWKSRTKYWIPQARRLVKKIRSECYRCRLLNKRNAQQLMAPLPDTRVLPTPAWTFTSLDLFGPLEHVDMVRKRMKSKCWGVLFTCRVSRAVHLDLTQGYDTDSLLQALRRFMALRGAPKEFLADQGTQIIACSKEVIGALELIDWNMVSGWCAKRTIEWKFVPPQAPHMNGVTESLVKSTKNILKQTLDGKRLTYAETQTVLQEAAQLMNCRPLGVYSRPGSDPLDGGPITPNHLLLGRASASIPDQKFVNVTKVKRMKFLQQCTEEFWIKWKTVVFHSLVPQYKWHKTQRNVQVGDVVLVNSDTGLVGEYRLGQVSSVKVGGDGLVRSAQVRCVSTNDGKVSKTTLERPIHKLCVIVPVEEQ